MLCAPALVLGCATDRHPPTAVATTLAQEAAVCVLMIVARGESLIQSGSVSALEPGESLTVQVCTEPYYAHLCTGIQCKGDLYIL